MNKGLVYLTLFFLSCCSLGWNCGKWS